MYINCKYTTRIVKNRRSKKNVIFGPLETNGRADGNQKKAFPYDTNHPINKFW